MTEAIMQQRILFSVNRYDYEGDRTEQGIYLHIGPVALTIGDLKAYDDLIDGLQRMRAEIEENWVRLNGGAK